MISKLCSKEPQDSGAGGRGGARKKRAGRGYALKPTPTPRPPPGGLPPASMSTTLLFSILHKISLQESVPVIFFSPDDFQSNLQ